VTAGDLPWLQPISAGTTAWRKSMGRRHSVEGVNTMIMGGFVNIERKFMRVFGRTKMTIVLAFTIADFNRDRIQSFMEKVATQITKKATRGKR
jgi:hypothetical protein